MAVISKVIDIIMNIMASIAAALIGFLLLSISYATISRYLFNEPLAKLIEISSYGLVYVAFLAAPWLLRQDGHIRVDLVLNQLSEKGQAKLNVFNDFVGFIVSSVVFYFSLLVTLSNFTNDVRVMDSLNTPQYLLVVAIPLGSLFLAIQFIRRIRRDFAIIRAKREGEQ